MSRYLRELEERGLSLLIYREGEAVFLSEEEGLRPFIDAIDALGREGLRGAVVADRIVGRAAALLAVYIDAAEVHAALISGGAKEVLRGCGLRFFFAEETEVIKNREGTGICPFESLVQGVSDPEEAFRRIKTRVSGR